MNRASVKRDFITGLCVIGLGMLYGIITPFQTSSYVEGTGVSGRALPLGIAVLLAVLGAALAARSARLLRRLPPEQGPDQSGSTSADTAYVRRVLLYLLTSALYVAGIEYIGFIVSSFAAIPCLIVLSGGRSKAAIAITAVAAPLLLYAVFTLAMEVYLPEGLLL